MADHTASRAWPWPPWCPPSPQSTGRVFRSFRAFSTATGKGASPRRPTTPCCSPAPCPTRRGSSPGRPTRCPGRRATGPVRPWPPTRWRACRRSTRASRRRWERCTPTAVGTRTSWRRSGCAKTRCPRSSRWVSPPARCPEATPSSPAAPSTPCATRSSPARNHPGDVLVIFGATLIVWAVCDEWLVAPGLISYPHTTRDRFLIGGPSNAGALFVDWARRLLPRHAAARSRPRATRPPARHAGPCPRLAALRPGRANPLRGPLAAFQPLRSRHRLWPEALERAAYEASGFVVRRMLDRSGVKATRIVASGGGSRSRPGWRPWPMPPACRSTPSPYPRVRRSGAAYFARMAAGLETSLDDSARWSAVGRRIEPDPAWVRAAERPLREVQRARHRRLADARRQPLGVKATFSAPLWSWRASALSAGHHSSSPKRWVSMGVMSSRPSATSWR